MLGKVRLDVSPDTLVKDLGVGKQQLVEIAKALSRNVKLLVLDEPTAALNEDDCENLFLDPPGAQGPRCHLCSHLPQAEGSHQDRRHGDGPPRRQDHLHPRRPQGRGERSRAHQEHGGPGDRQRVPAADACRVRRGRPARPGVERLQPEDRSHRPARTSPSTCTRARSSGSPASWARDAPSSRGASSAILTATGSAGELFVHGEARALPPPARRHRGRRGIRDGRPQGQWSHPHPGREAEYHPRQSQGDRHGVASWTTTPR